MTHSGSGYLVGILFKLLPQIYSFYILIYTIQDVE